jgi:repressor LexA
MPRIARRPGRPPVTVLTAPQQRALKIVEQRTHEQGRAPTILELADELGIKGPSAHHLVNELARKGYLARAEGKTRGLHIVRWPDDDVASLVAVPLLGEVPAGKPLLAEDNILGEVLVEGHLVEHGRCFALRVRGESMFQAKINDGDIVIVRQQPLAESGDIVVALLDGESTIKRLYLGKQQIELLPENSNYQPVPIEPDTDFRIVGKVVGIRRIAKN